MNWLVAPSLIILWNSGHFLEIFQKIFIISNKMYPHETHIAPRIFVLSQILFKIWAFKVSKLEVGHPVVPNSRWCKLSEWYVTSTCILYFPFSYIWQLNNCTFYYWRYSITKHVFWEYMEETTYFSHLWRLKYGL